MGLSNRRWQGLLGRWGAAALLFVLAPGAVARAGDPPPTPPPSATSAGADASGDGSGEIPLGTGLDVQGLLQATAKITGRTILWSDLDKSIATRKIIGAPGAVLRFPKGGALASAQAVLLAVDVVLIPLGPKGYEFWWAVDSRMLMGGILLRLKSELVEVNDDTVDALSHRDGTFVTVTIPLENLDNLRDARTAVARLVTQNNIGSVTEVPAAGAIMVSDFAPNVAEIYRVLRQMNTRRGTHRPRPEVFQLAHATARVVEAQLRELYPSRPSLPPGAASAQSQVSDAEVRVTGDEDTNQVVVLATEEDLAAIRIVIRSLDRPAPVKAPEGPK